MINTGLLVPYGTIVLLLAGSLIFFPYLRKQSDLLTGWNTLLLGMIFFTGFGCFEARYGKFIWERLDWFQPTPGEVQWYVLASAVFFATLIVAYYLNAPAQAFAARRLTKWPAVTVPLTFFIVACCLVIMVLSLAFGQLTFLGPLLRNLSHKAAVFACVFSFYLWYRNRLNIAWLGVFVGIFLATALFSMMVFSGRRLLLSIFLGPVLCVYWIQVRHWRPSRALGMIAIASVVLLAVSTTYSTFRWFNRGPEQQERTAQAIVNQLRSLRSQGGVFDAVLMYRFRYFAQSNVHYSLLTQRFVSEGKLQPKPLNTLRFLAAYPIPRRLWSGKPESLGVVITRDAANIKTTNWGVGIPGHGAYEGGIPALMLYAVLLALLMRCMDEPIRLRPDNPFLISLHAAALPHVVAFPRGDFGIMAIETAECFLFAVVLGVACRAIFGTERSSDLQRALGPAPEYGYPVGTQRYSRTRFE